MLLYDPDRRTVLLARQFFDLQPSTRLKYATLGVLFVNISIGGTLTQFAAERTQLTDQVHSVQQVVGGVVPLQQPTSRDLALPLGDVANVNPGNPGSGLADVLSGKAPLLDLPQMGRSLQDDGAGNAQEQPSVLPAWESTAPEGIPQPDQHGVEVTQHGQDGEDGANGIATAHGTSDQEQLTPQEQQSLVNDVFTQVSEVVPVSRLLS